MLKDAKVGKIYKIENKERYNSAAKQYNLILVENPDGNIEKLFFTNNDLLKAIDRARANQEDIPKFTLEKCGNDALVLIGMFFVSMAGFAAGYFVSNLGIF